MLKTAFTIAILALAASGIIFIIKNPISTVPAAVNTQKPAIAKPLVEALNISEIQSKMAQNEKTGLTQKSNDQILTGQENLTETFTKKISDAIAQNNPAGTTKIGGKPQLNVPDPDSIADSILTDAAKYFDPNSLKPIIKDNDLKISEKTDEASLISYFQSFNQILSANSKTIPQEIIKNPENISIETIKQLIPVYKKTIAELYALAAPKTVLPIHKKELELLGEKATIFEKILSYESDPLLAILAAKELKNVDEKFTSLSEEIKLFIKNG